MFSFIVNELSKKFIHIVLLYDELVRRLNLPHCWPTELSFIGDVDFNRRSRGRPRKDDQSLECDEVLKYDKIMATSEVSPKKRTTKYS
jgi:hypothetical protein